MNHTDTRETPALTDAQEFVIPAPLSADDRAAYDTLREGVGFIRHNARHWSRFSGPKAAETLNGLVTNDVTTLAVGSGQYAAALSPKGKMLADIAILRTEPESFLVGSSAAAGAQWWSMIRKYVNPRLAQYRDESAEHIVLGVYGIGAPALLAKLGGASGPASILGDALEEALSAWPLWRHAKWSTPNAVTRLVRVPTLGAIPAFELLVEPQSVDEITARLVRLGALQLPESVFHIASIEGGRPAWGYEIDDSTIPQEANLDVLDAVSFDKGCYTGQETVARIHFRGHVNRHMRGLMSDAPIPAGATLADASGKIVGGVKRSGISPARGPIATAMVRREVAPGSSVIAKWADNHTATAVVIELPFA